MLRAGSQSALTRRVGDELRAARRTPRPRRGACAPARRSSASPSSCCSTRRSRSSPSTAGPAPARRCWPSPPGSSRSSSSSRYERLAVYRPLVPVGRADVGFLPGGLDEKLDPWMSAIHDAIVALTDHARAADARRLIDELTARGQLSLESVTFLRGRSLQRQMVVIDEAQNLEPTTLRTILTRVGEGTKVVFTGDTSQIDAPYLGESNNALAVLTQAFGGQRCFGHITLTVVRAQRRRQPRRRAAVALDVVRSLEDSLARPSSSERLAAPSSGGGRASRSSRDRGHRPPTPTRRTARRRDRVHIPVGRTVTPRSRVDGMGLGPFAVVDVETSGLRPRRHHILQIGLVTVEPTARSSTSGPRWCACAGRGAASGRRHVHGITRRSLRGAPPAATALAELAAPARRRGVHRPQRRVRRRVHRAGGAPRRRRAGARSAGCARSTCRGASTPIGS